MSDGQGKSLGDIREDIDAIDARMHELLIERSAIVDALIKVKKTAETGSAFRPQREASMMRAIVERHSGILPIDTVESIWRVIISTFTYVQAPYTVHVDTSPGDGAMRDVARFHFGFTPPLETHLSALRVIQAVTGSRGDLGVVHAGSHNSDAWWNDLASPEAPKIIARLPFVIRSDHPIGLPAYVLAGNENPEDRGAVRLFAIEFESEDRAVEHVAARFDVPGWTLVDAFADLVGVSALIAVEREEGVEATIETVTASITEEASHRVYALHRVSYVGSHAKPYDAGI